VLFLGGQGSNFSLFHILSSSPLQHSGTTVRVCDDKVLIDLMFDSNVAGSLHGCCQDVMRLQVVVLDTDLFDLSVCGRLLVVVRT